MEEAHRTARWKIVGAWLVVLVPLAWGVAYTVKGALNLVVNK